MVAKPASPSRVPDRIADAPIGTRANLFSVRTARLWLLIVLSVLLPVRAAVAAAMLCPVGSSGMQSELRVHPAGHEAMDHALAHEPASGHHDPSHDHAAAADHEHAKGHGASDHCNACSAYCSMTPLLSEVASLPIPLDPPGIKFPDLSSPAPTFLSDGQERPPRSI